jgi:hypothetical protein
VVFVYAVEEFYECFSLKQLPCEWLTHLFHATPNVLLSSQPLITYWRHGGTAPTLLAESAFNLQ